MGHGAEEGALEVWKGQGQNDHDSQRQVPLSRNSPRPLHFLFGLLLSFILVFIYLFFGDIFFFQELVHIPYSSPT